MDFSVNGVSGKIQDGKLLVSDVSTTKQDRALISRYIQEVVGVDMLICPCQQGIYPVTLVFGGFLSVKEVIEVSNLSIWIKNERVIIDENLAPGSHSILVHARKAIAA